MLDVIRNFFKSLLDGFLFILTTLWSAFSAASIEPVTAQDGDPRYLRLKRAVLAFAQHNGKITKRRRRRTMSAATTHGNNGKRAQEQKSHQSEDDEQQQVLLSLIALEEEIISQTSDAYFKYFARDDDGEYDKRGKEYNALLLFSCFVVAMNNNETKNDDDAEERQSVIDKRRIFGTATKVRFLDFCLALLVKMMTAMTTKNPRRNTEGGQEERDDESSHDDLRGVRVPFGSIPDRHQCNGEEEEGDEEDEEDADLKKHFPSLYTSSSLLLLSTCNRRFGVPVMSQITNKFITQILRESALLYSSSKVMEDEATTTDLTKQSTKCCSSSPSSSSSSRCWRPLPSDVYRGFEEILSFCRKQQNQHQRTNNSNKQPERHPMMTSLLFVVDPLQQAFIAQHLVTHCSSKIAEMEREKKQKQKSQVVAAADDYYQNRGVEHMMNLELTWMSSLEERIGDALDFIKNGGGSGPTFYHYDAASKTEYEGVLVRMRNKLEEAVLREME